MGLRLICARMTQSKIRDDRERPFWRKIEYENYHGTQPTSINKLPV
ncbi:protein of unknown function [Latilactobacillus sakei]|nr:protein of unknown function [Latilactobacillus sakei]